MLFTSYAHCFDLSLTRLCLEGFLLDFLEVSGLAPAGPGSPNADMCGFPTGPKEQVFKHFCR